MKNLIHRAMHSIYLLYYNVLFYIISDFLLFPLIFISFFS